MFWSNSSMKASTVYSSLFMNLIDEIFDVSMYFIPYLITVWNIISAHFFLGNPKLPVAIAGMAMLWQPSSSAIKSVFLMAKASS